MSALSAGAPVSTAPVCRCRASSPKADGKYGPLALYLHSFLSVKSGGRDEFILSGVLVQKLAFGRPTLLPTAHKYDQGKPCMKPAT